MEISYKKLNSPESEGQASILTEDENIILCASCFHHITEPEKQIKVNQSYSHIFSNPYGIVYEILCFSEAGGCCPASLPSNEFTWFAGYSWSIAACSNCFEHLGWHFSSDPDDSWGLTAFWGLIIDKLIFT